MPEIRYNELKACLSDLSSTASSDAKPQAESFLPVYLIYGDEYLYKQAFEVLLKTMLPTSKQALNHEQFDGADASIFDVIEQLNTYSFMSGMKVVSLTDSRIFYSKQDETLLLDKARQAFVEDDPKKAAKYLANVMALLNYSTEDIRTAEFKSDVCGRLGRIDAEQSANLQWLDDLIHYFIENRCTVPAAGNDAKALQDAIRKKFPRKNHLIITAEMIDKRRGLYKTIKEVGMVIDCSVPAGNRMADRKQQEALLADRTRELLMQYGKTMSRGTYQNLVGMTGFNLRTFSDNLEKLVTYVGERREITAEDVQTLLERTRQDPIYEFTGAFVSRDLTKALFYLHSLLKDGFYPLQILAAMINQIRKLLMARDFAENCNAAGGCKSVSFSQFKNSILPAMVEYDRVLLERLNAWEETLTEGVAASGRKKKSTSDLLIAKNPKNPYPIYQVLLKSCNFTRDELIKALELLHRADLRLKTGGEHSRFTLEETLIRICRGENNVKN